MKYVLISAVVFFGCVLLLGPVADSIAVPAGVARVLDDVGNIF